MHLHLINNIQTLNPIRNAVWKLSHLERMNKIIKRNIKIYCTTNSILSKLFTTDQIARIIKLKKMMKHPCIIDYDENTRIGKIYIGSTYYQNSPDPKIFMHEKLFSNVISSGKQNGLQAIISEGLEFELDSNIVLSILNDIYTAREIRDIENLKNADQEVDFIKKFATEGIGFVKAENLINFYNDKKTLDPLNELQKIKYEKTQQNFLKNNELSELNFLQRIDLQKNNKDSLNSNYLNLYAIENQYPNDNVIKKSCTESKELIKEFKNLNKNQSNNNLIITQSLTSKIFDDSSDSD